MKVAFVVFARNKAPWIAQTIRTVLAQTYSPMQLVFSDQGSEDETLAVIKAEVAKYNGPNEVLVLECPVTEHRQHPGLIDHINWLHNRLDADYWLTLAADDLAYPDRAKRTVEIMADLREPPLFFATKKHNVAPAVAGQPNEILSQSGKPDESGYITPQQHLEEFIGGSSSGAWRPDLLEMFPLNYGCLVDVYMPFCAALKASFYCTTEIHHAMVYQDDPNNLGLEGIRRQTADDDGKARVEELIHYQLTNNLMQVWKAAEGYFDRHPDQRPRGEGIKHDLLTRILNQSNAWADMRQILNMNKIDPMRLPV